MKQRSIVSSLVFLLLSSVSILAQEKDAGLDIIQKGVDQYKQSDFQNALIHFREILSNPAYRNFHGDSYFWIAKANISLSRYDEASKNLEIFLKNHQDNAFYPEGVYEKGRLLFLQGEYESSLQVLQSFLSAYPDSPYVANAYYWAGESLFALGNMEAAERMFNTVVSQYPTSFRNEAARYRLSLIGMKYREEELLKLLKWSHEEYLKALEEFNRRETMYTEAMGAYQRRISALTTRDFQAEIVKLNEQNRVLEAELKQARTEADYAKTEKAGLEEALKAKDKALPGVSHGKAAAGAASSSDEQAENRRKVLSIKEEALNLKEFYLGRVQAETKKVP